MYYLGNTIKSQALGITDTRCTI
ncbi:hypothetical protein VCR3J2_80414 [Vibrio coralliirubri]|nr:hypothetical protein VCR29J2_360300 [Vibrio coralliirubri]CDU04916.1 hypothetical protein VCR3J2_80414 [Vibrio coralliirubri]